jgi:hypothetical protein
VNLKFHEQYFHCGDHLKQTLQEEIEEVRCCVSSVQWQPEFKVVVDGKEYLHQTGYNKALGCCFGSQEWESQPVLKRQPKLIGDFRKRLVFIEVQFGNSATLYRDYYKFQYGHANGLLSLAVLIVPTNPSRFFPTRPNSVKNMAEYALAVNYFTDLPINVPTLVVGLLPQN